MTVRDPGVARGRDWEGPEHWEGTALPEHPDQARSDSDGTQNRRADKSEVTLFSIASCFLIVSFPIFFFGEPSPRLVWKGVQAPGVVGRGSTPLRRIFLIRKRKEGSERGVQDPPPHWRGGLNPPPLPPLSLLTTQACQAPTPHKPSGGPGAEVVAPGTDGVAPRDAAMGGVLGAIIHRAFYRRIYCLFIADFFIARRTSPFFWLPGGPF